MSDLIGKTLGPYRILEQIGVGGMATVYKAYQPSMDRDVAIKILPHYLSQDAEFAKRFQREARAIARLEHAHILPVYDYGEGDGTTYIAMRYVQAGTLKERIARGPLPLDEINRLVGQVGSALDYAHRLGIIHRDVKPSNVLIDDQGDTYLTDFGLARMMESSQQLTASGVGVGTPAYMSPEQGQGIKVDHRSDIYSLGVVLYEMVTGHVPYEAETPMGVVLKHISDPLPLPRKLAPNVPEGVEKVILRALAKDPAHRFQTAGEMVEALNIAVRKAAPPEPAQPVAVEAAPSGASISFVTRVQRTWEKPRGKFALIGGTAIVLVVLGVLLSQLPGRVQIAAPGATTTAAIGVTPTPVSGAATAAIAATAPPPAASPVPVKLTLTLRLRLNSTSDWADLTLLSSAEIVEARTVEFSPGVTQAAMDVERRTIDLDQPIEASEAGKQVSMLLDLVLAGVPAEWDLRFNADKGCLGTLKVEVFNLSVGEPVPIKDYIVEGCNPPFPRILNVPAARLAEILMLGPEVGDQVANWCDDRWPGQLCLHDLPTDKWTPITSDQRFQGDRGAISWSPDGQRLVYSAARKAGEPQHLYWINADGTGEGQLTQGDSRDHEAAWSPGGEWIAFARDSDLWLVRPDGSEAHPLLEPVDYDVRALAWSPDGREIAYLSHASGLVAGIWVVSAEGGQPRLVYDCGQACGTDGRVAWTPDGRKLLYWHFQKEVEQRLLVFADGSGIAGKIEGVPYWWHANFWPPWGRVAQAPTAQCRIAYEKDGDIFIRNCDGSGARRITTLAEDESAPGSPAWSPDGEYIVFHSGHESQPEESGWVPPNLYIIRADGSDLTPLTSGNHSDLFPAWSPDGSRIAFHRACSLVTIAANGSNLTMIAPESDQICAGVPTWSPDGQRIAFSSWKPGSSPKESSREIYVVNSDGTDLRKLAHFEVSEVWTTWSSDGQQIGIQAQGTDNVFKYYLVNADGSGETVEIESIPESWYPWYWPQWGGEAQTEAPALSPLAAQARAFAEPILQAIADRQPDFADDFSTGDKGWSAGNQKEGAAIQDGVARLRVTDGDAFFGNNVLSRKDFVLQVDARMVEGDLSSYWTVRFHGPYRVEVHGKERKLVVDYDVPGGRSFFDSSNTESVSPMGEVTRVTIVARGPRAAIYLNSMPVVYFEDAEFDTAAGTMLFCTSISPAVCEFDNVKLWNLENVPGLP